MQWSHITLEHSASFLLKPKRGFTEIAICCQLCEQWACTCSSRQGSLQITPEAVYHRGTAGRSSTKAQGSSKCWWTVLCSCLSSMAWGETTSGQTMVRYLPGRPSFVAINLLQPLPSSPNLKSSFFSMDGSHNQHQNEGHASALTLIVLSLTGAQTSNFQESPVSVTQWQGSSHPPLS